MDGAVNVKQPVNHESPGVSEDLDLAIVSSQGNQEFQAHQDGEKFKEEFEEELSDDATDYKRLARTPLSVKNDERLSQHASTAPSPTHPWSALPRVINQPLGKPPRSGPCPGSPKN